MTSACSLPAANDEWPSQVGQKTKQKQERVKKKVKKKEIVSASLNFWKSIKVEPKLWQFNLMKQKLRRKMAYLWLWLGNMVKWK